MSRSPARAVGIWTIALSPALVTLLQGDEEQERLWARSVVKHELGHLNHFEGLKRILHASAVVAVIGGINWGLENWMSESSSHWTSSVYALGS
jgi:hypothetical protein